MVLKKIAKIAKHFDFSMQNHYSRRCRYVDGENNVAKSCAPSGEAVRRSRCRGSRSLATVFPLREARSSFGVLFCSCGQIWWRFAAKINYFCTFFQDHDYTEVDENIDFPLKNNAAPPWWGRAPMRPWPCFGRSVRAESVGTERGASSAGAGLCARRALGGSAAPPVQGPSRPGPSPPPPSPLLRGLLAAAATSGGARLTRRTALAR